MSEPFNSDIPGQQDARRLLGRALQGNRLGHAYLFHGPAGVGKSPLARDFARALACAEATGCGRCGPCARFDSGNYADFILLETGESSLKIEAVRGLIQLLSRKPVEGRRKVALIPRAERLTTEAQNALLKTLEAPPADAVLLLTTDAVDSLLSTIVSRCQLVACRSLSAELLEKILVNEGLEPERAAELARRAEGSPGRARELAADQETLDLAASLWQTMLKGDLTGVYASCAKSREREEARRLVEELAAQAATGKDDWSRAAAAELAVASRLLAANANLQLTLETVLGTITLSRSRSTAP